MKETIELTNKVLDRVEAKLAELNEVLMSDVGSDFTRYRVTLKTVSGDYELHTYCIDGFDAYCKVSDILISEPFIQVKCNCGLRYIKSDSVREIFVEA